MRNRDGDAQLTQHWIKRSTHRGRVLAGQQGVQVGACACAQRPVRRVGCNGEGAGDERSCSAARLLCTRIGSQGCRVIAAPALMAAARSRVRMSASCLCLGCDSRTRKPRHAVCTHSAASRLRCRYRRARRQRTDAWMAVAAACRRTYWQRHQACSTGAARRARRNHTRALKVSVQGAITASAAASRAACAARCSCRSASRRRYTVRPRWPRYAACRDSGQQYDVVGWLAPILLAPSLRCSPPALHPASLT